MSRLSQIHRALDDLGVPPQSLSTQDRRAVVRGLADMIQPLPRAHMVAPVASYVLYADRMGLDVAAFGDMTLREFFGYINDFAAGGTEPRVRVEWYGRAGEPGRVAYKLVIGTPATEADAAQLDAFRDAQSEGIDDADPFGGLAA